MLEAYRTPDRLLARIQLHERFGNSNFDLHNWIFDLLLGSGDKATAGTTAADGGSAVAGSTPNELSSATGIAPTTANVLEIGAGTGRMWQVVAGRVPPRWSLTLTDRSEGMVADLAKTVTQTRLNAVVTQADARGLPFDDATFDLAFANHMLYHVPKPTDAISELRRVLKPGGLLIAATNGDGHMRQVVELAEPLHQLPGIDVTGIGKLTFTCESGGPMLAEYFPQATLHEHNDELSVTDAQALLAYMQSLVHVSENAPDDTLEALQAWEQSVLAVPLPFKVERRTGVFVARAPGS